MRRVAVFGNAGGGKSILSRRIGAACGLPVFSLDQLQWRDGHVAVPEAEFVDAHDAIVRREAWVLDGFGTMETFMRRLAAADTIVFVDYALWRHYWWDLKRAVGGLFATPVGWPEGWPVVRTYRDHLRLIWSIHRDGTPWSRRLVRDYAARKQVIHLRTVRQTRDLLRRLADAGRR
jgi:adenylate kinase family enzyme